MLYIADSNLANDFENTGPAALGLPCHILNAIIDSSGSGENASVFIYAHGWMTGVNLSALRESPSILRW